MAVAAPKRAAWTETRPEGRFTFRSGGGRRRRRQKGATIRSRGVRAAARAAAVGFAFAGLAQPRRLTLPCMQPTSRVVMLSPPPPHPGLGGPNADEGAPLPPLRTTPPSIRGRDRVEERWGRGITSKAGGGREPFLAQADIFDRFSRIILKKRLTLIS